MAVTIRLDVDKDVIEMGNEEIGFAKFEASAKDIAWARKFAEHLEEEGVDVEIEESDDEDTDGAEEPGS